MEISTPASAANSKVELVLPASGLSEMTVGNTRNSLSPKAFPIWLKAVWKLLNTAEPAMLIKPKVL